MRPVHVFSVLFLFACGQDPATVDASPDQPAIGQDASADPPHAKDGAEEEEDYGGETSHLTHDQTSRRTAQDGTEIVHVGHDFTEAALVSVAELVANPDAYADKIIQVKGPISAMCTHKRGWFAIAADDQSGQQLRVMTGPVFLVPEGSIGKDALAEGKVEVIVVKANTAKHLSESHSIGEDPEIDGPSKQVVLRATGADFS